MESLKSLFGSLLIGILIMGISFFTILAILSDKGTTIISPSYSMEELINYLKEVVERNPEILDSIEVHVPRWWLKEQCEEIFFNEM